MSFSTSVNSAFSAQGLFPPGQSFPSYPTLVVPFARRPQILPVSTATSQVYHPYSQDPYFSSNPTLVVPTALRPKPFTQPVAQHPFSQNPHVTPPQSANVIFSPIHTPAPLATTTAARVVNDVTQRALDQARQLQPSIKKTRTIRRKECDVCGKLVARLQTHRITHLAESDKQRFSCTFPGCGKGFPENWRLIRHKKSHLVEKERPFKCTFPGCGKGFLENWRLKRHEKFHLAKEDRPFKCVHPGCEKRFSEKSNLKQHLETHSKKHSLKCVCGSFFKFDKSLIKHLKKFNCK